ncbi:2-dehydropantoate 2-reductase [Halobacteriales archaeon SW_7_71_33]|nr:MAG: 2-dehydropantoate 2-reductase [Halobacteriales archaeon SW_7_71_33]
MDVAVLGAGSIGSLLGGLLAREHPVTLVGRETHVTAVRRDGLTVTGRLECTVHPEARTDTAGLDADLVLVTVTAHDVSAAADQLARDADPAVVVPLSNGLGHADTLADRLPGATALAGTTTYGATLDRPGHVTCTGVGTVTVGARDGGPSRRAREVAAVFETAGVEATAIGDAPRRGWEKLAVNAGVNAATALARVENGRLADGPGRALAHDAARECARVARAEGIDLSDAAAVDAVDRVVEATAANRSSMRQDLDAGRRTEVDAINGHVVDRAGAHDLAVPTNETLTRLLRLWERGRGLRR